MTEFELLLKVAELVATDDNGSWSDPYGNLEKIAALLRRNSIGVNDL